MRWLKRFWWWISRQYVAGEELKAGQIVYTRGRRVFVTRSSTEPREALAFSDSHEGDAVAYGTKGIVGKPEDWHGLMTGRIAKLKMRLDEDGRLIVEGEEDE